MDASIFGMQTAGASNPSSPNAAPVVGQDPRKKRMIDQIMQARQVAGQGRQQFQTGGPEYLDWLQQMAMNPMATFYLFLLTFLVSSWQ